MALDEALLEAAGAAGLRALRLYAWDPATLSFGRNEPALTRYDRAHIAGRGLAAVRRPTGGRAVWHHREVTYSVVAPADTFGSLRETYHAIHALLAEALFGLGAAVRLAADRAATGVGAGACFASAAGGEVVTPDGAKVVGSAQVRLGGAFLQHGSILLVADQDVVSRVTRGTADAPVAAGLDTLVGPECATWDAVADAVAGTARRRWGLPETCAELPAAVRGRAEALRSRYADESWTWRC
jgi:lipoate-protein ligase A